MAGENASQDGFRNSPAILILHFAERGCVRSTSRSDAYAELLGVLRACCGWSGQHSRVPAQNEDFAEMDLS